MSILPVAALIFVCIASAMGDCEYDGKTYATGEQWKPDACTDCVCSDAGYPGCVGAMCVLPACADWTTSPDSCCPFCPNGETCEAPDGTIIPASESVKMSDGSTCYCDPAMIPLAFCHIETLMLN